MRLIKIAPWEQFSTWAAKTAGRAIGKEQGMELMRGLAAEADLGARELSLNA
jgi:hypothetical protein